MTEDSELLRRYSDDGSESAFAELVQRHVSPVYSVALRRLAGDGHAAADVTQLVFTALARQARTQPFRKELSSWLYVTTRNKSVDYVRAERRRRARERTAFAMQQLNSNPIRISGEKLMPLLDEMLEQLPRNDRDIVLMRFIGQRSFSDIAEVLHVTEDAARRRVDRALGRVRTKLAKRGISSTAAALGLVLAEQVATAAPSELAGTVASAALQAASVVSPMAGWICLMSTPKMIGIAGIALALTLTFAVREARALRTAENDVVISTRELGEMASRVSRANQRAKEAESVLTGKLKHSDGVRQSGTEFPDALPDTPDPAATGRSFLAVHPETAAIITGYARARARGRYHELFLRLGLTPDQINRFCALALQLEAGIRWNTATQVPAAEINIGDQTRQQVEDQIHSLLGDEGFAQYVNFTRDLMGNVREVAEQVGRSDYFSDSPITPDQARLLTEIVAIHSPEYREGGRANSATLEWDGIMAEAAGILNPSQLAALGDIRERVRFDADLKHAINQAVADAKKAAGISP